MAFSRSPVEMDHCTSVASPVFCALEGDEDDGPDRLPRRSKICWDLGFLDGFSLRLSEGII